MDAATEAAKFAAIVKAETSWYTRFRRRISSKLWVRVTSLLLALAMDITRGVVLMVIVYVIHEHWIAAVPTIGLWWAVLLVFLYDVLRALFRRIR